MLHRTQPEGEDFRMLGVLWDTKLSMQAECEEVGKRAFAKVRSLLKLRRYYSTAQLVAQYKTHVLPALEFPIPAVYHGYKHSARQLGQSAKALFARAGLKQGGGACAVQLSTALHSQRRSATRPCAPYCAWRRATALCEVVFHYC